MAEVFGKSHGLSVEGSDQQEFSGPRIKRPGIKLHHCHLDPGWFPLQEGRADSISQSCQENSMSWVMLIAMLTV